MSKKAFKALIESRMAKIDVSTIQPGDRWTIAQQEAIIGVPHTHPKYGFGVMHLVSYIKKARRAQGQPLAIWNEHRELVFGANDQEQWVKIKAYDRRARTIKRKSLHFGALLEETKFTPNEWSDVVRGQERRALEVLVLENHPEVQVTLPPAQPEDTTALKLLLRRSR